MPRYHLNLFNDADSIDYEGSDYRDLAAAKEAAIVGGRSIIADHVTKGQPINLNHRVEVADDTGKVLAIIPFREIITIVS